MQKHRKWVWAMNVCIVWSIMTSCQYEMKQYYQEPEWIKGSIYEILREQGDYSIFLQGVDTCQYTPLLEGRSILTVMAPKDSAMRAYLKLHYQTEDLAQLPLAEVKKLIGFHILYYAFDTNKLMNFRPSEGDAATADQKEVNAGLYYKFRTRSQDAPEKIQPSRIMLSDGIKDTSGIQVDVYHLERFIPVFSHRMFQTKCIDAKYNYEYFFPESKWNAANVFNVSDAVVTSRETVAKNGYIYFVDRVIRPLETIHKELEQNPEYSQYLKLYDAYAYYDKSEELSSLYGGGHTNYYHCLYERTNFTLPNIAQEWPVTDYNQVTDLSYVSNSVFAPTNAAFNEFYTSYWGDEGTGYPSKVCYDSISSDAIAYLLSNSFYSGALVFPEEIRNGLIKNAYTKTLIQFDVDKVPQANRKICVNGALYGQSELTPPPVFGSVTGPAYKYKDYSLFLKMLTASEMQSTLTSDAVSFIVLYPSNAQFNQNHIWYDSATDRIKVGIPGSSTSTNMGSGDQRKYVTAHMAGIENRGDRLSLSGLKVYRTLSADAKLYWYVKDGKITNSFKYNSLIHYAGNETITKDSVYTDFNELTFRGDSWSNGYCYEYDTQNGRFLMEGSNDNYAVHEFMSMMYLHRNEKTLFQGFINVLLKADMIDQENASMTYMTENCLMLVPSTEAVQKAIVENRFPYLSVPEGTALDDVDFWSKVEAPADGSAAQDSLRHYLFQYFMPESMSPTSDYPYYGWGVDVESDGGYSSIADLSGQMAANVYVYVYDRGDKLTAKVQGMDDEIDFLGDYDYLPFVFDDGCVHFIKDIFEDKWPH